MRYTDKQLTLVFPVGVTIQPMAQLSAVGLDRNQEQEASGRLRLRSGALCEDGHDV